MSKIRKYGFYKDTNKLFWVCIIFTVIQEILLLVYPLILKGTTDLIKNDAGTLPTMNDFLLNAGIVLGFIILIMLVTMYNEYRVAVYVGKVRTNARMSLFEKITRIPTDKLSQYGTGKALATLTTGTNAIRLVSRENIKLMVVVPISILGSLAFILFLSFDYFLITLCAIPFVLAYFFISTYIVKKIMPKTIKAYDSFFETVREGIVGARDIRMLGKAGERRVESVKQSEIYSKQGNSIDRARYLSVELNAIIFAFVTAAIILFGATSIENAAKAEQLVILSTVIQYVNYMWNACNVLYKSSCSARTLGTAYCDSVCEFMELPEEDVESGVTNIPTEFGSTLIFHELGHTFWNGRRTLSKFSLELSPGKLVVISGGAGGGKTTLMKILLRYIDASEGSILLNGVNIKDINKKYFRSKIMSISQAYPHFVNGTVRDNIKMFNPDLTDEQILSAFNDIGAVHLASVPLFLDSKISNRSKTAQNIKSIINIVRCILKPAQFYIFNRCFLHLSSDIIDNTIKRLRTEGKTALFITFNPIVCKTADEVYFSRGNNIYVKGTHKELVKSNPDYAKFFNETDAMEDTL